MLFSNMRGIEVNVFDRCKARIEYSRGTQEYSSVNALWTRTFFILY